PVVERKLTRIVATDDMELIEIIAGLERLGIHLLGGHPEDARRFLELVGCKRAEFASREAYVGRVDIAVENVENFLPALALFLFTRDTAEVVDVVRAVERESVFHGERGACVDLRFDLGKPGIHVVSHHPPILKMRGCAPRRRWSASRR